MKCWIKGWKENSELGINIVSLDVNSTQELFEFFKNSKVKNKQILLSPYLKTKFNNAKVLNIISCKTFYNYDLQEIELYLKIKIDRNIGNVTLVIKEIKGILDGDFEEVEIISLENRINLRIL